MGFGEIILIMVIALVLFGPEELPSIARKIGKVVFEIRKVTQEFSKEFQSTMDAPSNVLNKAFEQTISTQATEQKEAAQANGAGDLKPDEKLLRYEDEKPDDPLAELPSDMVSYEEKGASR